MSEFILGSHNSLSYLPIKHWWQRFTAPWARCQKLSLREQYDAGVRLFDIRVRFDKECKPMFCHNNVIFDYSFYDFYEDIKSLPGNVYIRLILDVRKKPADAERQKMAFLMFSKCIKEGLKFNYKVSITEMRVFWEWNDYLSKLNKPSDMKLCEVYGSVSKTWYRFLPPKWFAKVVNIPVRMVAGDFTEEADRCLMIDYVD